MINNICIGVSLDENVFFPINKQYKFLVSHVHLEDLVLEIKKYYVDLIEFLKYEIGQVIYKNEPIAINEGSPELKIVVRNTGDRTIQVCSHYHFFEVNKALDFDRAAAYGMHLDIPSGTAVRFEPGTDRTASLVPVKGARKLFGFAGWVNGPADDPKIREKAFQICKEALGHDI